MTSLSGLSLVLGCVLFAVTCAADTREEFLKLIDRPRGKLAATVEARNSDNGLKEFHFSFAADGEQRVPGILVEPAGAADRKPVVIVLHGTGGTKESELPLMRELVKKGFVVSRDRWPLSRRAHQIRKGIGRIPGCDSPGVSRAERPSVFLRHGMGCDAPDRLPRNTR